MSDFRLAIPGVSVSVRVRLKQTTEWKVRKVSAPPLRDCSLRHQVAVGVQQRYQICNPGLLLANILLKDFNEQRSSTTVNLLGTPGQRWGSVLPSRVHYVVQCTLSRKSSLSEKSERYFPTSEREKYFGVASGSTKRSFALLIN